MKPGPHRTFTMLEQLPQSIDRLEALETRSMDVNMLVEIDRLKNEQMDTTASESFKASNSDSSRASSHRSRHVKSKSIPIYYWDREDKRNRLLDGYYSLRKSAIQNTGHIMGAASNVAKKIAKYGYKLISFWELPEWLRDNIYIHHHYRPQLDTFRLCFRSIFSIHSETGNIWTHLVGLIILIAAMVYIFVRPTVTANGWPHYPSGVTEILCFLAFFIGGSLCLTFSWLFHTLCCHSPRIGKLFAKLDYSGIAFLICGSMIPVHYFAFYCHHDLRIIYITVAIVMAILCIIASLWDTMSTPAFRPVRATIFLAFGLSSIVPIVHHFVIHPIKYSVEVTQIYWLITMGSFYVVGCLLYIFLVPERFFPGKLNVLFQSHQIFHVFVVIGTFLHLHALCRMSAVRVTKGRTCLSNETNPTSN